jgi:hypothetical protein
VLRCFAFVVSGNPGETVLPFPHFREEEFLSHNLLIYTPRVIQKVGAFLMQEKVGTWTTAECDEDTYRL